MIEKLDDVGAVVVDDKGEVHISKPREGQARHPAQAHQRALIEHMGQTPGVEGHEGRRLAGG